MPLNRENKFIYLVIWIKKDVDYDAPNAGLSTPKNGESDLIIRGTDVRTVVIVSHHIAKM